MKCVKILLFLIPLTGLFVASCDHSTPEPIDPKLLRKDILPKPWPPKVGQPYPDLELVDHRGQKLLLSQFKGKTIVIQPVAMASSVCQAYSGANKVKSFGGMMALRNVESFEQLLPRYTGGNKLGQRNLVFVQILLYDLYMNAPTPEDAKQWAHHFRLADRKNVFVTVPFGDLRNDVTFTLFPGFQLIDPNFILVSDSTGKTPKEDLYKQFLPALAKLL